ncbi:hypothetical protein L1049_006013 [Liquidambar formosana]|uniref:Uncharacterized protein n=1 Tax=Liquidambar formosana TaxID=63359 RepID=A0AAP0RF96_LIQFO
MASRSSAYHAKHHHHDWDATDDYRVHASTMEPMPSKILDAPRRRNVHVTFSDLYEERVPETRERVRVVEYERAAEPAARNESYKRATESAARNGSYKACEENIDAEADEFIEIRHRKFELSKWMSMNAG